MTGEFIIDHHRGLARLGYENAKGGVTWIAAVHIDQASDLFGHDVYLALYRDRKMLWVKFEAKEM